MERDIFENPIPSPRRGIIGRVSDWYSRWERPISSLSLIGGFVFDAVTLTRVDLFWENVWVVVHIAAVAIAILLINFTENMRLRGKDPSKIHFWLMNILQFFFGGIFSTFLVYYFRAGTLSVSWPFMAILVAAFVANERLKKHYSRLVFQVTLLFLSIYAFAIFIVPVIIHAIGPWVFVLSGAVSLVIIWLYLLLLRAASHERFRKSRWLLYLSLGVVFGGINVLYFYNYIPPLPLSLKDGGVYSSLIVNAPGKYTVTSDPQGFWSFLDIYKPVTVATGSPVFAYTAVFSPAAFKFDVIHEWQYYSTSTSAWRTFADVPLSVAGGSDGGWRTFSSIVPSVAGNWRVNVKTPGGAVIGRIDFSVHFGTSSEPLVTTQID